METMLAIEILTVPTIAMRAAKSQSVRNIFTTTFIIWLKFMTHNIDVCTNSMANDKTNHESVYLSRNPSRVIVSGEIISPATQKSAEVR
jgi:hypothetical protein